MASSDLVGGLPFAPQPKSYMDKAGDLLHGAATWLHGMTPSFDTISKVYPGTNLNGDVLDGQAARIKAAYFPDPIGGPQGPNSLFGPATYPQTVAPRPEGLVPPAPPPTFAERWGDVPTPAPALPAATNVGPAPAPQSAPAPTPPVMADATPDTAWQGPHSVGGAPLTANGAQPAPYNFAGRLESAAGKFGDAAIDPDQAKNLGNSLASATAAGRAAMQDAPSFFARNSAMMRDPSTGSFLDPNAARSQANGPDVIQKFLTYLHNK